jgi:hypothetical protein
MDWSVCPKCGMRYLPNAPSCPGCFAGDPGAAAVLSAALARGTVEPLRRDPLVFALHLALAASLVWMVERLGSPTWVLALAALELMVAVGALFRWKGERYLVYVRAGLYAVPAALLFHLESDLLGVLLFVHSAAAYLVFDRRMVGTRFFTLPAAVFAWILILRLFLRPI